MRGQIHRSLENGRKIAGSAACRGPFEVGQSGDVCAFVSTSLLQEQLCDPK